jgi:hypothetical protein
MAKTIKVQAIVRVPLVPNFLLYDGGKIAVGDVPDEDLKKVAEAWLEKLLANAERQRKEKIHTAADETKTTPLEGGQ